MPDRLQEAKYERIGEAVARFAQGRFATTGQRCDLLDVGGWAGMSRRFIEIHEGAEHINFHGAGTFPNGRRAIYKNRDWTLSDCNLEAGLPGLESNAYDVVFCEGVLSRIRQTELALGELARVLKPGGLLVLGVPTRVERMRSVVQYLGPIANWFRLRSARLPVIGHPIPRFSARSLKKMVRRATNLCRIRSKRLRAIPFWCYEIQITATKRIGSGSREWFESRLFPIAALGENRVAAFMANRVA